MLYLIVRLDKVNLNFLLGWLCFIKFLTGSKIVELLYLIILASNDVT